MIKKGDVLGYKKSNDFRDVVLEDLLKMFVKRMPVEIVKLGATPLGVYPKGTRTSSRPQIAECRGKATKIAIPETTDLISNKIINEIFKGDFSKLKLKPLENKIIKPLCLFLDREVLLYAKLNGLKFSPSGVPRDISKEMPTRGKEIKEKNDKVGKFINELEKKHPEIKHSIVKSYLELFL